MQHTEALLALNGALALLAGAAAGLPLWRASAAEGTSAHWHLLHASGTSRGIMLIALAAARRIADMAPATLAAAAWLVIFFVWTSILAMFLRALTGAKGFGPGGGAANHAVFVLYAAGTPAAFIGLILFARGFAAALG